MARSRRRTQAPPPQRLILDSGAVIALSRNDQRARAVLTAARKAGVEVVILSVVVAETVRGSARDASVNRVVKAVGEVAVASEKTGRTAGALLGAARSDATIDALVVASAIELGGAVVLTSDLGDLAPLAANHREVKISPL